LALKKRDTYVYRLKQKIQTVYIGISTNPYERVKQHKNSGKKFTKVSVEKYPTSRNTAKNKESKKLKTYRKNNGGRNPKYNKTKKG